MAVGERRFERKKGRLLGKEGLNQRKDGCRGKKVWKKGRTATGERRFERKEGRLLGKEGLKERKDGYWGKNV